MFVDRMRHGRVLPISEPVAGSSLIHQNSPLRGIGPGLRNVAAYDFELLFNSEQVFVAIGYLASASQCVVLLSKPGGHRFGYIAGPLPCRDAPEKLARQRLGNGKRHLSGRHNGILPYLSKHTVASFIAVYKLLFWGRFSVGILGEYIGSIHTHVQKRPLVVERERVNFEYEPGYAVPSGETVMTK
jgi:hypothetical protein